VIDVVISEQKILCNHQHSANLWNNFDRTSAKTKMIQNCIKWKLHQQKFEQYWLDFLSHSSNTNRSQIENFMTKLYGSTNSPTLCSKCMPRCNLSKCQLHGLDSLKKSNWKWREFLTKMWNFDLLFKEALRMTSGHCIITIIVFSEIIRLQITNHLVDNYKWGIIKNKHIFPSQILKKNIRFYFQNWKTKRFFLLI